MVGTGVVWWVHVPGVGMGGWCQVEHVPTTRDGVWVSGPAVMAGPGWSGCPLAVPPVGPAPFQSQDRARVYPSSRPVRVVNHGRGGPAKPLLRVPPGQSTKSISRSKKP